MTRYYIGFDVGGSKTHALVADENGVALGFGKTGGGNHEVVGYEGLSMALQASAAQALKQAGLNAAQITGAGFGLGGYDWPSELPPTLEAIKPLGFHCPLGVVNDAMIGLIGGASQGWGISIVSGSGCNCYGRDRKGKIGNLTGMGDWMGENAGAGGMIAEAVKAVSRAWSKRGPETRLTELFCTALGAKDADELIEGITQERLYPSPQMAPLVFKTAAEGDAVAQGVIRWVGESLADLGIGVVRQLHFESETFEAVLIGSMFKNGEALMSPLRNALHKVAPGAQCVRLSVPPVVGGTLLGMEKGGVTIAPLRARLVESAKRFLAMEEE
jgi:N-acetylglucosamine kinase-like BadF-type ATPase